MLGGEVPTTPLTLSVVVASIPYPFQDMGWRAKIPALSGPNSHYEMLSRVRALHLKVKRMLFASCFDLWMGRSIEWDQRRACRHRFTAPHWAFHAVGKHSMHLGWMMQLRSTFPLPGSRLLWLLSLMGG
jgi:hypothetical protein